MYIVFDIEPNFGTMYPNGWPTEFRPIAQNSLGNIVFRLVDGHPIPTGGREALITETKAMPEVLAKLNKLIETTADEYQQKFLGIITASRNMRFSENRLMALDYKNNIATDEEIQALQVQVNAMASKGIIMTLDQFADWIIAWLPKTRLVSGNIEAYLVQSIAILNSSDNLVDPVVQSQLLNTLRNGADVLYNSIVYN